LLAKIENQKIKDPLVWEQLKYERNEWDNIPGIVPKYVIYVAKYVEGISAFCKKLHDAE